MRVRPVVRVAILVIALVASVVATPATPAEASITPSEVTAVTGCDSSDCGEDEDFDFGVHGSRSIIKTWVNLKIGPYKWSEIIYYNPDESRPFRGWYGWNIRGTDPRPKGETVVPAEQDPIHRGGPDRYQINNVETGPVRFRTVFVVEGEPKNRTGVQVTATTHIVLDPRMASCDAVCKENVRGEMLPNGERYMRTKSTFTLKWPVGFPWGCEENEQGRWKCPGDPGFTRSEPVKQNQGGGGGTTTPARPSEGSFTCSGNNIRYYSNGTNAYRMNGDNGRTRCPGVTLDLHVYGGGKLVEVIKPDGTRLAPARPAEGWFTCPGNNARYYSNGSSAYRMAGDDGWQRCPGVTLPLHVYRDGKVISVLR